MSGEWLLHNLIRKYSILLLVLIINDFNSYPQSINSEFPTPVFEYITKKDGLPDNTVTYILQDYLGYLWLGTRFGLVKYDGYSMKIFRTDIEDTNSISNGDIITIYEDKNKNLWIGTVNGLNKFNRNDESFKKYNYSPDDRNSINDDLVHGFCEDKSGRLWIATHEGLNLFDRDTEKFIRYYFSKKDSNVFNVSINNQNNLPVNAVIEDPITGDLLIGTCLDGLWNFNLDRQIFTKYKFKSQDSTDKKIGWIQALHKSRDGKIWMASYHTLSSLDPENAEFKSYIKFYMDVNAVERYPRPTHTDASIVEDKNGLIWSGFIPGVEGIFCLNPANGYFQQYKIYPVEGVNYYNKVFSIFEDNSGILWIGSWLGGLVKFDKNKTKFHIFKSGSNGISHSFVRSLFYDPKGFIWFCTANGLDRYELKTGKFYHYLKNEKYLSQGYFRATMGIHGEVWIGSDEKGLIRFNPEDESCHFYFNVPNDSLNLLGKTIQCMFQDHFGILWIGTLGNGLYIFDITKNKLFNYKNNPKDNLSLSCNWVSYIFEDNNGIIWIGSDPGFDKFDRNKENFIRYGTGSTPQIFEDKKRNLWIADYADGLYLFDRKKGKIIANYNHEDGLASNEIWGILEDAHDNLWLSTDNGLSKFSIENKTFKNYYEEDGLPDNRFVYNGFCKSEDGTFYFATNQGPISFHPDSVREDPIAPKVVLSRISLFNRPDEKLNYKGFISELKEIILPYDQNDLRFDYLGLHFSLPKKNKYKYILENFDKDWVDAGNQRNAVYTNLDPGKYIFRVNTANKDGIWNKTGASIIIIITPPWWKTTYAYFLYVLIITSIIYVTWRLQLKRIRVKHEYEMSKFEAEKLHEVDELKSRFFTNISHEFRTPLTLILGPSKQIIERTKEEKTREDQKIIYKNARKLLGLVNQLLDISKLESGNMKLQTSPQNIVTILKALLQSFCSYAERKRITLKFNSNENEIIAYIDKEKFEKIITNLLSNAFKFTPESGEIEVSVNIKDGTLIEVSICDTGTGIPKEKIQKIFDRFYQVDGNHTREQEGTGIGLSLTKELVELHKGNIKVESEEGKGTIFTISLPMGKEHLKTEEICESGTDESQYIPEKPINIIENKISLSDKKTDKPYINLISDAYAINDGLPRLLIVEDNSDVRNYIKNILKKNYKIFEAVNGEDGWNKALEATPDLIVSDVMMPKMDGFKLCEKLKTDERTSHIPLILLTAKASSKDRLEGYETGADEYLMKPFDAEELKARIKNLIEQRKRLHEYFRKEGILGLKKTDVTSVDMIFLKKALDIITQNLSNPSFTIEAFADNLAISRSLLNKKIVSLTGEAPRDFVRRLRLRKAAELIKKNFGNLSEIALEVGFNNPAYFSECFKKQFDCTPSQYQKNNSIN